MLMIFTLPVIHYFIFLCDLPLQDIGFICLRIYLSNTMQMTHAHELTQLSIICLFHLFLFHFSVSILRHQNKNVNKETKFKIEFIKVKAVKVLVFIFTNKILKQTIKE